MELDSLRDKLREQEAVYQAVKEGHWERVRFQKIEKKGYGTADANHTSRLRLASYLLYEGVEDEAVTVRLFQEELKDREHDSFQGIGTALEILTCLLGQYNEDGRYDALFQRAKNANFDCACGYDPGLRVDGDLDAVPLAEAIGITWELNYPEVIEALVDCWRETVADWDEGACRSLVRWNRFLQREADNEALYRRILELALAGRSSGPSIKG